MKNVFGTDGIRAKVGSGLMTPLNLKKISRAIATWASKKYQNPRILIAQDTRESAQLLKENIFTGLAQNNLRVFDAGILPTPAACVLIQHTDLFDCAVVLSASHNPYSDNGIKIFDRLTTKISTEEEEFLSQLILSDIVPPAKSAAQLQHVPDAANLYMNNILSYFDTLPLSNMKIVLDVAHGATYHIAPTLFERLGATTITINNKPNGKNINENCGSIHPETLRSCVLQHQADIGFAFDGDGDRVIAVNRHGEIKDGDDLLAILLQNEAYKDQPTIVGTTMSNEGLVQEIKKQGKTFIRADVGDKYVHAELVHHNLLLGGESSGHIILHDYLATGDGIFNALKIAQTIKETENWDMSSFQRYPQILINLEVDTKKSLTEEPLSSIIEEAKKSLGGGRLVVRYSGTQNLLRVMVEDTTQETTNNIAQKLVQNLKEVLKP